MDLIAICFSTFDQLLFSVPSYYFRPSKKEIKGDDSSALAALRTPVSSNKQNEANDAGVSGT